MILYYVADSAGLIVKSAASLDSEFFSHGDLNILDMRAIPDRLQERIRETAVKHVVNRLLAKVMIDTENCLLLESSQQNRIQRPCRKAWPGSPSRPTSVRFPGRAKQLPLTQPAAALAIYVG